jgi:hypothetical protein
MVSQWFGTKVVLVDNHTELLFSTEDNFAVLRSVGLYDAHCGFNTAKVSSQTDLRATYLGLNTVYVEAAVEDVCSDSRTLSCDGQPWANSTWHAEFQKEPNQ